MRLKVLRRYLRRGKPRCLLSRSRSLLQSLATKSSQAERRDFDPGTTPEEEEKTFTFTFIHCSERARRLPSHVSLVRG
eukprot:417812-Pleurochrysis_carterae.AAC.1